MYAVNPSRDSLLVAVLETFSPRQSHSLLSLMLSTCPSDKEDLWRVLTPRLSKRNWDTHHTKKSAAYRQYGVGSIR
jgi:hypothetical protein